MANKPKGSFIPSTPVKNVQPPKTHIGPCGSKGGKKK